MISTFTAKLTDNKKLTADVHLLSFAVPQEFSFQAGQFVTLILRKDAVQKPRSYSILNPPSESGKLDLCVKLVESGFASEIFNNLQKGDELSIKGPFGHFLFDANTSREHWFIGTGTGISPLYSMIKEHLPQNPDKVFKLLMGYKTSKDLLFHDELLALKAKNGNFEYIPILSREAWNGETGHVQDHLSNDFLNKTFYICGLKELVLETKELLTSRGVPPEKIKFERYT